MSDESSPAFVGGGFQVALGATADLERIQSAFLTGEGMGWHEHGNNVFEGCRRFFEPGYRANLLTSWIPSLDSVHDRLQAGGHVADVGCGHGASSMIICQGYPSSQVTGFDYHEGSIAHARRRAREAEMADRLRFEVASADGFPGSDYDLVTCFDCLHDMGDPVAVARHVRGTLADDGAWMIVEPKAGDRVEENLNPVGRAYYAFSTMLCTPNALSQGGKLTLGAQARSAPARRPRRRRLHPHPTRRRDPVQPSARGPAMSADTSTGARFAQALVAKDFARVATLISGVLRRWFDDDLELEGVSDLRVEELSTCQRVAYRLNGHDPDGPFLIDHHACLEEQSGLISQMRLLCFGFHSAASNGSSLPPRAPEGNEEATAAWNGPLFERFVRFREILTSGLGAHGEEALRLNPPQPRSRVLDIGCGFGDTTQRIAALVAPDGQAVGVDVAPRFIELAGGEAQAAGVANARFHSADVQAGLPEGRFDYAFSRFGTMFFANPVVALRNVRRALRPGGQLCMVVWRRKLDNDWLHRAETVVERHLEHNYDSGEPTCRPGPFSMADADTTSAILLSAGFEEVRLARCDIPIRIGRDMDEAVAYVCALGPAGELIRLAGLAAQPLLPTIDAALRDGLAEFDGPDGVIAPASTWIVTASARGSSSSGPEVHKG